MSVLKTLNGIGEKEKNTLKELLLDRIEELHQERERLYSLPDTIPGFVEPKLEEVNKLIKYNEYLFHWLEDPPTSKLQ